MFLNIRYKNKKNYKYFYLPLKFFLNLKSFINKRL